MKVRVLVLGYGNVGKKVVELLERRSDAIKQRWGFEMEIVGVVRGRPWTTEPLPEAICYNDALLALEETNPDVVVELIGGVEPARTYIREGLQSGAHVVTANKAVLAAHGPQLRSVMLDQGRLLLAEASVGGAIPVLRTLHTSLAGDRVERILGVWNGTCNYILTQMEDEQKQFEDILAEAQRLGYAEADPELDIGGGDTAHKASVLAQLSFDLNLDFEHIPYRGIKEFIPGDFLVAKQQGYKPKMIGMLDNRAEGIVFYVGPALVPRSHPIADLDGVRNGIFIDGEAVGGVFLSGPGAGPYPTAVTVVSDIIEAARFLSHSGGPLPGPMIERWGMLTNGETSHEEKGLIPLAHVVFPAYIRFLVPDTPGTLGTIAKILGEHGISIDGMFQPIRHSTEAVPIYLTTHDTPIGNLERAMKEITELEYLVQSPLWMPILERR